MARPVRGGRAQPVRGHCTRHSRLLQWTWFLRPQPPLPCFPDLPVLSGFLRVLFHGPRLCHSPVNTFLSLKQSSIFEVKMPLGRPGRADDWEAGLCGARSGHGVAGEAASGLPARRNPNPQQDLPQGGADLGHVGISPRPRRPCQFPFWTPRGQGWAGRAPGAGRGRDPAGEGPAAGKGVRTALPGPPWRLRSQAAAPPKPLPGSSRSPVACRPLPRCLPSAAPGSAHTPAGTALRPPAPAAARTT